MTPTLPTKLLTGDVPEASLSPEELDELAQLRKRRIIVRFSGPGPAWFRLTRQGRVEVLDKPVARPEPMF